MKNILVILIFLSFLLLGCSTKEKQTSMPEQNEPIPDTTPQPNQQPVPLQIPAQQSPTPQPPPPSEPAPNINKNQSIENTTIAQTINKSIEHDIVKSSNTNPVVFLEQDNLVFEHYWPLDEYAPNMKDDESEILVYNNANLPVQITSTDMRFIINSNTYDQYSGTWEKFPSRSSWDRIEYINIHPNYYSGEPPLILKPGQKGKIHYHYQFSQDITSNPKQSVKIKITYKINDKSKNIDLKLDRKTLPVKYNRDDHSEQPQGSEGESSGH
ncbi:hypothetical protein J4450_03650 [Candidatus Micrarchaeota archaeon]|nr:hypothetical protein [Candidatus Micrarchaeota archaeon]